MSLDANVVAGNTLVSFSVSPSFLSSLPTPPRAPCIQTRPLQQVSNEVWLSSVPVPCIWFPFHLCPLHTHLFFLLSFMSPVFMSWHSIPSFFWRAVVRPLVCTRASTCTLNPGFRSPRFENEVGFIVCPCALGSFIATTYVHLCPVLSSFHVFIFLSLLRAHVRIRLNLSFLASPRRRRVCAPLGIIGILSGRFLI